MSIRPRDGPRRPGAHCCAPRPPVFWPAISSPSIPSSSNLLMDLDQSERLRRAVGRQRPSRVHRPDTDLLPTPSGRRTEDLRRSLQRSPSASFPGTTTSYSPSRTGSHQQQRRHPPDTLLGGVINEHRNAALRSPHLEQHGAPGQSQNPNIEASQVERTLAWLTAHRRLVRDCERHPATSEDMIRWAAIGLMTRRLARGGRPMGRQGPRTLARQ